MALTEDQVQKAMAYVARKMQEDKVNPQNPGGVVRWMIENPLPSREEYQAQVAAWEEEDKAESIVKLEAQLAKLRGE